MRATLSLGLVLALLVPAALEAADVNSVQSGTASSSGNGTTTVTINSVDTSKAFLIFQTRHDNGRPSGSMMAGRIASSTSLEFARVTNESGTINIQWYVVEYSSGVNVQRGSTASNATTIDVSISAVAALDQAFVTWSKTPLATDTTFSHDDPTIGKLTSTSNLRFTVSAANSGHTIWWQVIEFTDPDDINVRTGSTTMLGADNDHEEALSPVVNLANTFVLASYRSSFDGPDVGERMLRVQLQSDKLTLQREDDGDDLEEVHWQIVELFDGTNVQHFVTEVVSGNSTETVSVSSVDPTNSIAFSGVQPVGGQNMGSTAYAGDDVIGVGSFTFSVAATSVTLQRNSTVYDATVGWFLVEFTPIPYVDVTTGLGFDSQSTTHYHDGSGLHWGDLDNDGDLDAIITGNSSSRLVINNNEGSSFSVSTFGGGGRDRQGALVDLDNDGDLDFWHRDEKFYENDGSASFSDEGNVGFSDPDNNEGVAGADVNHDGWVDILMFSQDGNWIGHHQGSSSVSIVETTSSSYGLNDSGDYGNGDYCSSGDVNNDGYLDFFYHYGTGKLFLSDGDGTYTEDSSGISVVTGNNDKIGSAWADYDNDGDLDLFVPRYDSGQRGYLWRNDNLSFTDVTTAAGITNTDGQRSCCWGDYDNDGDLDLYLVTRSGADNVLYQNQGDGTFLEVGVGAAAPGDGHDAVFVDFDNDGDLDLSVTQEDEDNVLLRNQLGGSNYLKVRVVGYGGGGTNRAAIGTRVEVWDAAGTTFIARRDVGLARGFGGGGDQWLHFGGLTATSTYTVKVYFDSVPLASPVTTSVVPQNVSTTIGSTTIPQMVTITETVSFVYTDVSSATGFNVLSATSEAGGLHWGDFDNDGDLDCIAGGHSSRLLLSTNEGASFSVQAFGSGTMFRQASLSDVDNDGDLDFFGMPAWSTLDIYINDGNASFTDTSSWSGSTPNNNEGVAIGDLNADGWPDLVAFSEDGNWIGHHGGAAPASFTWTDSSSYGLNDSSDSGNGDFCCSGDVNEDGRLDFFYHYNSGKLFLSDGDGTYTEDSSGVSVHTGGSDKMGSAFADYDNDGDLDLFVCRWDSGSRGYLWRNDSGTFTDVTTSAGVDSTAAQASCCWGDYDNDGDLDLYITTPSGGSNLLYQNQGDGTFVSVNEGAGASGDGHDAVFVDYDNDGDLDLAVIQEDSTNVLLANGTDNTDYLKVRVVGQGSGGTPLSANGVRVELYDSTGTTYLGRREVGVARGFGGSEPHWVHFGGVTASTTYQVHVYFNGLAPSNPRVVSVTPNAVSTTIGAVTIPQMLTVEEAASGIRITDWREKRTSD